MADDRHAWSRPGVEAVAPGVHRIPLPLPNDGLHAVNVYAIEDGDGLVMVDAGWAVEDSRAALEAGLAQLDHDLGDIRRFLVTHLHRDHWSQAVVLRRTFGMRVALGIGEQENLEVLRQEPDEGSHPTLDHFTRAGAHPIVERLQRMEPEDHRDLTPAPDEWLDGEVEIPLQDRTLVALPTPGHTRGHVVFLDPAEELLFSGDHVLPHITPSIGFQSAPDPMALVDYLDSLAVIRARPDLRMLPAHGPTRPTTHPRVDELLEHHDHRLRLCLEAVDGGASTGWEVSQRLPWTRRDTPFSELNGFNKLLAVNETQAHLDLLVHRGVLTARMVDGVAHHARSALGASTDDGNP